jgi:hypothetical protein
MFQASLISSSSLSSNGIDFTVREYTSRFGGTVFHAESLCFVKKGLLTGILRGQGTSAEEAVSDAISPKMAARLA